MVTRMLGEPLYKFGLFMTALVVSFNTTGDEPGADNVRDNRAAEAGKALFNNTACSYCHHKGGRKAGKGPKLANSERTDEFLFDRIQNGKAGRMASFGKAFSDEQIWSLVAYIRSLDDDKQ